MRRNFYKTFFASIIKRISCFYPLLTTGRSFKTTTILQCVLCKNEYAQIRWKCRRLWIQMFKRRMCMFLRLFSIRKGSVFEKFKFPLSTGLKLMWKWLENIVQTKTLQEVGRL